MTSNFRDKLNFEKKTVVFVEKEYTLKTDHKTGLLLQELQREAPMDANERMVELLLGKEQAGELFAELEETGSAEGAENYVENINVVVFGLMSVLYDKPYEDFEDAYKQANIKK